MIGGNHVQRARALILEVAIAAVNLACLAATWSRYPDTLLVLVAGAPGPAHILGRGYRDDPPEGPSVSEFDQ